MWYGKQKKSYYRTKKRFCFSILYEILWFIKESTNVYDAFITMTKEIIKNASNKKNTAPKTNNIIDATTGKTINKKNIFLN